MGKDISCPNNSFEILQFFLLVVCQKRQVFYLSVLVQGPARLQWQDHDRPQPCTCVHPFSAGALFQNHRQRWWKTCTAKHTRGAVSRKQNSKMMASNVQIQSTEQREHKSINSVQILCSEEKKVLTYECNAVYLGACSSYVISLLTSSAAELLSSSPPEPMLGMHTSVLPSAMTYSRNYVKLFELKDIFETVTCWWTLIWLSPVKETEKHFMLSNLKLTGKRYKDENRKDREKSKTFLEWHAVS